MALEGAIQGMFLFNAAPAELASIHVAIRAGLACGALNPVVGREIPLAEADRAHEAVMRSGALGKTILVA